MSEHRRGFSIVEGMVAASLVGIALLFVANQSRLSRQGHRYVATKKAVNPVHQALAAQVADSIARYMRTAAPNCNAAGLSAALSRDLGNGIRVNLSPGAVAGAPPQNQVAAARCAANNIRGGGVNTRPFYYFCLRITASAGAVDAGYDSILSMQPFFGEFRFDASNTLNSGRVTCSTLRNPGNDANTEGLLRYNLHWSQGTEPLTSHRFAGVIYVPRI